MIGSGEGWRFVPCLGCERPIDALGNELVEVPTSLPNVRCRIVPGYQYVDDHGKPDLMRGEETLVLGALSLSQADGWFVLPGTHSKWVLVENGHVEEIMSFITGELLELLSERGSLAGLMQEPEPAPLAFEAGVMAAGRGGLTHMAFGCRALVLTEAMPAAHAYSYLSGLLIGAEMHEIRHKTSGQVREPVQLVGPPELTGLYAQAAEYFNLPVRKWQADEAYLAALRLLSKK
jgi:2-dehydro-3-deoxygalactonokinase